MKAVSWRKYGAPDVLVYENRDMPSISNKQILVKVYASSVTSADSRIRACRVPKGFKLLSRLAFGLFKPKHTISGMEFSGVVESIGVQVKGFTKGDEVFGTTGLSLCANAEYIAINPSRAIIKKPKNLNHNDVIACLFGGVTAIDFLTHKTQINANDTVLLNGASGAVGLAMLQLCKHLGAQVTAICSGKNVELVTQLGANAVIDYSTQSIIDTQNRYDVIIDTIGTMSLKVGKPLLNSNGKLLLLCPDFFTEITSFAHKPLVCGVASESKENLQALIELMEQGAIKPVIDRVYPLQATAKAHAYVDTGRKTGSVVIEVIKAGEQSHQPTR